MDFQHRVGSKTGGGGVAGWSESNRDRKERLKKLAMETIDINKVRTIIGTVAILIMLPYSRKPLRLKLQFCRIRTS